MSKITGPLPVKSLSVGSGIQSLPTASIPANWDREWFQKYVNNWLAQADIRNATAGPGITISGTGTQPATVSAEVSTLEGLDFVLLAPDDLTPDARTLEGQAGVVTITDGGAGSDVTIGIADNGIGNAQLRESNPYTVIGNPTSLAATPEDVGTTQLTALINIFTNILSGAVPAPGSALGNTYFLAADGTWDVPAGSGTGGDTVLTWLNM